MLWHGNRTLSDGFALPDPFAIGEWSDNTSKIPEVTYPDIYPYLKLVSYFHQIFIFSPNDSLSKTMKNAFYFS